MSMTDVEVITYGGGDLLRMVFNAVAMLFYGSKNNSSFVQPLCIISAMIGGAWGVSRCFFQSYTEAFLTKYMLPLLAIPALLIVPQARVHVIDKLNDKPLVVDHVPLLFAKIAGMTSYWGFRMTQAIENVMHTPNDVKYCKTGMIFGSDAALDFSRLKLNNGTLAQNLHHFTQQCIIYDIALGRYTIDQLRRSSQLLTFLKNNTSKVRMIPYVDPDSKKMEYLTCIESVDKMGPLFNKEVEYYTKHEVLKKIPITYQTLLNFKQQTEDKISNQIANATSGDVNGLCKDIIVVNAFNDATTRFATERAKDNQRNIYQTAGSLAGNSLVTMRIVFEALIYASFALILPLSLLPGGIKFIGSWVFLNIWIQLWPPLYGILNYITVLCAQKYASSVMGGLSEGFSLFTSVGFQDIAFDTAALSGFLSLSVPVISFYILQNVQSLVHLTGSLMTPAHSSAIAASSELSTGNYSFANTSMGQVSYENQTAFQQNTAPTLSSGFFTDNHGTHQIKYGENHLTVNQDPSNLNTSISTAEAYTNSLQNAQQNAETQVNSKQGMYTETRGIAERNVADIVQHVASSDMYSNGYSTSQTQAAQESANWITNAAESWGHQHGVSGRESLEYFSSLGMDWPIGIVARGGHSANCSTLSDEARQSAENIFISKDFQEHYQRALNCTNSESTNFMTDEGKRLVENYATSMEKLKSSQEQFSTAHSELNQISENLSYVQSNTNTVNTNLNTEFGNWLNERGALGTLFDKKRTQELNTLRDAFIEEKCQSEIGNLKHFNDPSVSSSPLPNINNGDWEGLKDNLQNKASEIGLSHSQHGQQVIRQYEDQASIVSHKLSSRDQELNDSHKQHKEGFDAEHKRLLLSRLNERTGENIQSVFNDPGINWSWFDDYANP